MNEDRNSKLAPMHINVAEDQRNAARDFFEITNVHSLDDFLGIATDKKIRNWSIERPGVFKRRFKAEVSSPAVREKILAWKNEKQITDSEMKQLIETGYLKLSQAGVLLTPRKFITIFGIAQLHLLSLTCGCTILQIALTSGLNWRGFLGQITMAAIWFSGSAFFNHAYIEPALVLKRIGA